MAGRIGSLILKDTIQFARDKTILAVVFWMYTIEVLICGYGMGLQCATCRSRWSTTTARRSAAT